jgi:hypothetical protein
MTIFFFLTPWPAGLGVNKALGRFLFRDGGIFLGNHGFIRCFFYSASAAGLAGWL